MIVNKDGTVRMIVFVDDFEGDSDLYVDADNDAEISETMKYWEPGEKHEVYVKDVTLDEYVEVQRVGMDFGGHSAEEITQMESEVRMEYTQALAKQGGNP